MALRDRLRAGPRRFLASAALALTAFAGTACSDVTGIDENDVEGLYDAVEFTIIANGASYDVIANDGYMYIELFRDGTTEGEIYIPNPDPFGSDLFVDLAGEWEVRSGRVYVTTYQDTFLNSYPLVIESSRRLTIDQATGTSGVILDLRRSDF